MSDEPRQTYTARQIVLEFFPETPERLVPKTSRYHLRAASEGDVWLCDHSGAALLRLSPVTPAGNQHIQLCCDFCQNSAAKHYLQLFRIEVPNSNGRRYFYVTLCRDHETCELRRLSDEPIQQLLARVLP